MSILNKTNCGTSLRNTGIDRCSPHIRFIRGLFLVPPEWHLTESQLASEATVRSALEAAIMAPAGERIYPVPGFKSITDSSQDAVIDTLGDGSQIVVRDGNNNWTVQYYDGGLCLSDRLRSFNNSGYRPIFYDDQKMLFGHKITEADGTKSIYGVPMDSIYFAPFKVSTGSNVAQYRIVMSFQPRYINEERGFVVMDIPPGQLNGLRDMTLEGNSSNAGVINFSVYAGCSKENMYDEFSTELANVALYTAKNATGGIISITAVTAIPGTKSFNLVLDNLDADYPASSTAIVTIQPDTAAAFAAAGIAGFEASSFKFARG